MQNLIGLLFLILPFSDGDGQIHLATCSKGIPSLFSIAIARRVAIPMLASPAPWSTYMKVNFLLGVALFDISLSNIDCQCIGTLEKYQHRYGHFANIDTDIDKAIQ